MNTRRITKTITIAFYFIMFVVIIVACDIGQDMMHGSGAIGTVNWNWILILIGLGIGFMCGMLVFRRKR